MDRRLLYGGLLLTAAGIGLVHVCRGPKIVPGQSRVLLIGDSLAVGLGPPLRTMARESRIACEVYALSGTRADQWAASSKLDEKLKSFKPTLVLISLGTNDAQMTSASAVDTVADAQRRLLAKIDAAGAEVGWIGAPTLPRTPNPRVLAALEAGVADSHYFHSERLDIPRAPDGIHSTPRGYAGWAGAIWRWLR